MKAVFNLEALVSVEIINKKPCLYLTYKKGYPKSFWRSASEGGFEDLFGNGLYSAKELEKGRWHNTKLLVVDNVAYYRPYVELTFAGGKNKIKAFNSYEDALAWGKEQADKNISSQLQMD